nr:hypothetical protein [Candidatus Goldiibacteriota bacterium]
FYSRFGIKFLINPDYYSENVAGILTELGVYEKGTDRNNFLFRRKTQQFCVLIQYQSLCRILHGKNISLKQELNIKELIRLNGEKYGRLIREDLRPAAGQQ